MAAYEFKLTLRGEGETEEQAWTDAVDTFYADPGEPQEVTNLDDGLQTFTIILLRPEYATDDYGRDTFTTEITEVNQEVAIIEAKAECCAVDGRDETVDGINSYNQDLYVLAVIKGKVEFLS